MKHAEDLCKVEDIVIKISRPGEIDAYRLTHDPLEEKDIIPQAYLDSKNGYNPSKEELDRLGEEERKAYATARALSMYTTEAAAEKQAKRLVKSLIKKGREEDAEMFKQEHGYVTKFTITIDDGMVTDIHKKTKHFNYFPNENVDVRELKDQNYKPKRIDYDTEGK